MRFKNKGRWIDTDYTGRLEEIRAKHGLYKKAMAEMCGISYQFYTRVERGEQHLSMENLAHIAQVFDEDFIWLLTGVSKTVKK